VNRGAEDHLSTLFVSSVTHC